MLEFVVVHVVVLAEVLVEVYRVDNVVVVSMRVLIEIVSDPRVVGIGTMGGDVVVLETMVVIASRRVVVRCAVDFLVYVGRSKR